MRIRTPDIRNAENSCGTHCNDAIGSRKSCLQSAEVKGKKGTGVMTQRTNLDGNKEKTNCRMRWEEMVINELTRDD